MPRYLFFILALILHCTASSAAGTPSWCENTPKHDSSYKNYVGRAIAQTSDQAFRDAVVQARKEAVEENFGFQFSVESSGNRRSGSESNFESLVTEDFQERSKAVRLEGFERVDSYSAEDPVRGISVCVWFRYPTQAVEKEKQRLAGLRGNGIHSELVIEGSAEDSKMGVVKINTQPAGASVSIDGKAWGETPIELRGKLPQGTHHLILDHPYYERVSKDFDVYEGSTTRIDELLKRATAHIKIETEPAGAMVMLQGRYVGESPLGALSVPAGEWITVVIEHPEAKRYERRIQLDRNELWEQTIPLELKRSHLVFSIDPKDANVTVDQEAVSGATQSYNLDLSAGAHTLHISRDGFQEFERQLVLKGGETLDLGTISLLQAQPVTAQTLTSTPISTDSSYYLIDQPERALAGETASSASESSFSPHWFFDLTLLQFTTAPIQNPKMPVYRFGASLEYSPFWLIGFRLGYSYGFGKSTLNGDEVDFGSNTLEFGLPIYFLWFHGLGVDSLFVEPEASISVFNYTVKQTAGDQGVSTPSQVIRSTGIDFGYRVLSFPKPDKNTVSGVSLRYGIDRNQEVTGGFKGQASQKIGIDLNFGF